MNLTFIGDTVMKFTFKFNGIFVTNNNVDVKLDGIEIEYECTTVEFVENIKIKKELMTKLPELVKQIEEVLQK